MNLFDYLKWRGDLSFKKDPFNEVDNFVFCALSYLEIDEYLDENKSYTIKEINDIYFSNHSIKEVKDNKSFTAEIPYLLNVAATTLRYKDCVIRNFYSIYDEKTTEQFCGMEFVIDKKTSYICYRGTDDTIVGWQEDFNFSYMITPAQISASNYLRKVIKPFHRYYVGGHSKGGNLACYAVLDNVKYLNKIITVYSNDGPGLNLELFKNEYKNNYELLKKKIIKFVPEYDVFGTIYGDDNDIVIKSSENNVYAHSILTWQTEGTKALRGIESNDTKMIRNAFKEFIENVSNDKKELFVNELFGAIRQSGIKNVSGFAGSGIEVLTQTIKNLYGMDSDSKSTGVKLIGSFIKQYKENLEIEFRKRFDKK